jgi:acetoin utilization deacetylase AcuC-like enzyme
MIRPLLQIFFTDRRLNVGSTPGVDRVLVIDCDAHQGEATAEFSTLCNDNQLALLSIHCTSNYPQEAEIVVEMRSA